MPLCENNRGMVCMENNALCVGTIGYGMYSKQCPLYENNRCIVCMENNAYCVGTVEVRCVWATMLYVWYIWQTMPFV